MKHFEYKQLLILSGLLLSVVLLNACIGNPNESAGAKSDDSVNEAINQQGVANKNAESGRIPSEKAKLERDNAKLNNELGAMKNATPPDVDVENWNGDIWQVPNPPSNIRTAPGGKILCTVKDKTKINLRGTSNIKDKNGEWLYTDYCGQLGFIHSTQIQMVDGTPAG